MSGINQARAIAAFNPTAPASGFLQPLFAGPAGDNKSYVQILADPSRIEAFLPVAWPERDCMMLTQEPIADVGGESLWGFAFDGEAPLVLPWSAFRAAMAERVQDGLVNNPLLQFDIVDTLDLTTLKRPVYTSAFERYRSLGRETAERWRDRAILEPALAKALGETGSIGSEPAASNRPYFRARISRGELFVALERPEGDVEARLNEVYQELCKDLPEIFSANAEVRVQRRARPSPRRLKPPAITVVLVGRIRQSEIDRDRWAAFDSEVVDADHFHPQLRRGRDAGLTIFLGAQSDWQLMIEVGRRMEDRRAVMVTLSTSASPLIRDLQFQEEAPYPTIAFFAPFATSTAMKRDPIQPIASLIEILRTETLEGRTSPRSLVAQNSMLIREPMWSAQTLVEVSCRIGARALRAGAVLEGAAQLYFQGQISEHDQSQSEHLLSPLFRIEPPMERTRLEGRRTVLLLLVERIARFEPHQLSEQLYEGARRLLEMRGWRVVDGAGPHIRIADPQRQFAVTIVDQQTPLPAEDTFGQAPGLGRAPMLVIHAQPKREQLLVGNRGQFLHIALEDIALMVPESPWIWPILRRQLLDASGRSTLAALRLAAALVAEAIRMNRVQTSFVDVDWDEVANVMSADDCERFVDFHNRGIERRRAFLVTKVANNKTPAARVPAVVELTIEDDGPMVSASVDML